MELEGSLVLTEIRTERMQLCHLCSLILSCYLFVFAMEPVIMAEAVNLEDEIIPESVARIFYNLLPILLYLPNIW